MTNSKRISNIPMLPRTIPMPRCKEYRYKTSEDDAVDYCETIKRLKTKGTELEELKNVLRDCSGKSYMDAYDMIYQMMDKYNYFK